jgi:hypothetical protein
MNIKPYNIKAIEVTKGAGLFDGCFDRASRITCQTPMMAIFPTMLSGKNHIWECCSSPCLHCSFQTLRHHFVGYWDFMANNSEARLPASFQGWN